MCRGILVALTSGTALLAAIAATTSSDQNAGPKDGFRPNIPKTWDDAAMATLEVPLANPIGSPEHAPARELAGYTDWLKQQEPVILWDDAGHRPPLHTEADWIKAGEIVFNAPLIYTPLLPPQAATELPATS